MLTIAAIAIIFAIALLVLPVVALQLHIARCWQRPASKPSLAAAVVEPNPGPLSRRFKTLSGLEKGPISHVPLSV